MAKTESEDVSLLQELFSLYRTLRKNIVATILFPALGLLGGYLFSTLGKDILQSTLVIETGLLSENEGNLLCAQLAISTDFQGLSEQDLQKIKNFQFVVVRNLSSDPAMRENTIYMKITASVTDASVLPKLDQALRKKIQENPVLEQHKLESQAYYDKLISIVDEELKNVEEIKNGDSKNMTSRDLAALSSTTVDFKKEKYNYTIKLQQLQELKVLQDSRTVSIAPRPGLITTLLVGFVLGVAALIIFLVIKYFYDYVKSQTDFQNPAS